MWKILADILEYHRSLISDSARCEAFHRAVHQTVKPGDVVLDIGTGTGLLAMFACQAGAKRVYALEEGMIGDVAEALFRDNGVSERVQLIRGRSSSVELPEKVDVVVSETLWNFGLGEGILRTLGDARARFLKPGGRIVPERMALRIAAVQSPERDFELAQWNGSVCGVNVASAYKMAKSNMYRMVIGPEMLCSDAQTVCELKLGDTPEWVRGSAELVIAQDSTVHGLGGWFDATLCPGVRLHNAPPSLASLSPTPTWKHAFMPLPEPLAVKQGDRLITELQCVGDESAWRWAVRHIPHHIGRGAAAEEGFFPTYSHSTLGGFPTALARLSAP